MRRVEDLGHAVRDLYEDWSDDEIDGRDRLVIAHCAELLALLVGHEVRARTTRPPRTGIAVRRAELAAQLAGLLTVHPE